MDFNDDQPIQHIGDANDTIEDDEHFGKFHGDRIVPEGLPSGVSLDDLRRQWMTDGMVDFEAALLEMDDGPTGYASYRLAWNGNQLHPNDCIAVLHSLFGDDLNVALSIKSGAFECNGILEHDFKGNEKKRNKDKLGGGCNVFIRRRRHISMAKRIRYVFATTDGGAALKMVADLRPAPLAGLYGKKLGDLVCADLYTKTFEPCRRNAELSFALQRSLGIQGLRMEVKYLGGSLGLYTADGPGMGQKRAAANRKLKNGVTVMYDGFNRVFRIAGGLVPKPAVAKAKSAEWKQSLHEEMRSTSGRRVKVWKLKAAAAEEEDIQADVNKVLETFGNVESCTIRASKDGCSWLVAVFETAEAAVLACTEDALGDALTAGDLADPDEGFCRSELCDADTVEADIARMSAGASGGAAMVQELGSLQTFAQAAGLKSGVDTDELMAKLLQGAKTTSELMKQLVQPTVEGVKEELVKTGRRMVNAVNTATRNELKNVTADVAEIKTMLKDLTKLGEGGVRRRVPVRKAKKTMDSPPKSAVKAVRKRNGSGAGLTEAAKVDGAMERLVGQLYNQRNGPAMLADLMDEADMEVISKRFRTRGLSDDGNGGARGGDADVGDDLDVVDDGGVDFGEYEEDDDSEY